MADETNDFSGNRPQTWTYKVRSDVEFKPAWRLGDAKIAADAIAFWRANDLIPKDATGEQRASEIAAVGYDEGVLCAVSTAFITHVDFVNCKLAMFRCAVAPEKRKSRISTVLTTYTRELLEAWSAAHPEEEVMGMGSVTQTNVFDGSPVRNLFRSSRLAFVGWTAQGHRMHLAWFEHARIAKTPGKTPRPIVARESG